MPVVERGACGFCDGPVLWGTLQNGRRRSFQLEQMRASEVPEKERFAARKGQRYLIDLEGIPHNPDMLVLVPHYCAQYRRERDLRNVESLSDMLPKDA